MHRLYPLSVFLVAILFLAGCASTRSAPEVAEKASKSPADSLAEARTKAFEKATESSRELGGLFTLYQDTTDGSLHLAVREDQIGKEFIYVSHIMDGVPRGGHFRGQYRYNRIFSIQKRYDELEISAENTSFHFDEEHPLSRAEEANLSRAVLAVEKIVGQNDSLGVYLIEADDLFLTEAFDQVKPTPPTGVPPGARFTLGKLSKEKTRYLDVRNYPENTAVRVEYVYSQPAPKNRGGAEVTDARNVSVHVQHSLIELPENDYQPRLDDPRIGYFTTQTTDLTSTDATPYRDLVHRWHLVKKDPEAELSEPVEPIVWWIENTTPHEIRDAVRDAVLAWNVSFEKAGFKNAVQVKVQPDDAEWDADDIRYNVLRWTSSPTPPFGGYGPSFVNPRTGQIIGADIMLEFSFLTNRLRQEQVFDAAALQAIDPVDLQDETIGRFCALGQHLHQSTLFGLQALRASGASLEEGGELLEQAIYYLLLHEVGHTLGLNHNMKASQMLSPAEMAQTQPGQALIGSVMDYPTVNLAAGNLDQGLYYTTGPGPYDDWAIEFGYAPMTEEERTQLLERSTEPELAFGNDADDMRSPGKAIDPQVMIYDLSSDAVTYADERLELIGDLLEGLTERFPEEGDSYHELRNAYLTLTGERAWATSVASRYVGGVYVDRAVAGQPGADRPFRPVDRADQERAMQTLTEHLFAPDAFGADEALYSRLQMQRRGFNFFGSNEDPKIHARALAIQGRVLDHLLHPDLLERITDTRLYGNSYSLSEMMGDLTDAVFEADQGRSVNSFRQNLQVDYVKRLITIVDEESDPKYDHIARSTALANLREIERLTSRRGGDEASRAHRAHLDHLIEQALER